jgi:hypothetical protein
MGMQSAKETRDTCGISLFTHESTKAGVLLVAKKRILLIRGYCSSNAIHVMTIGSVSREWKAWRVSRLPVCKG